MTRNQVKQSLGVIESVLAAIQDETMDRIILRNVTIALTHLEIIHNQLITAAEPADKEN